VYDELRKNGMKAVVVNSGVLSKDLYMSPP